MTALRCLQIQLNPSIALKLPGALWPLLPGLCGGRLGVVSAGGRWQWRLAEAVEEGASLRRMMLRFTEINACTSKQSHYTPRGTLSSLTACHGWLHSLSRPTMFRNISF